MNNKPKYHPDTIEEVREMYEDGLTRNNIAWYLGLPVSMVRYYTGDKKSIFEASKRWKKKNPESVRRINQKASKKWRKENLSRINETQRLRYWADPERRIKGIESCRKYYQEHKEEISLKRRERYKKALDKTVA